MPSQLSIIKEILPLIALLPSAANRTAALAHVWHAAVQLDLATRRAVRSGDKAVPGAQLKNVLTEPFVMGVVSGSFAGDSIAVAQFSDGRLITYIVSSWASIAQPSIQLTIV